jgi:hypothetical protein
MSVKMRDRLLRAFLLTCLASCVSGCAGYWADRGRDAADIFTLALGNGLGGKARVGPITAGLLADYTYAGLRGGEFCRQDLSSVDTGYESMAAIDWQYVVDNAERFNLAKLQRGKNFEASSVGNDVKIPLFSRVQPNSSNAYYTQVEAVLGLYASARVGCNPGELLDFILGFAAIDIYRDDLACGNRAGAPGSREEPGSIARKDRESECYKSFSSVTVSPTSNPSIASPGMLPSSPPNF